MSLPPVFAASALYDNLLQAALRQFFGRATFETEADSVAVVGRPAGDRADQRSVGADDSLVRIAARAARAGAAAVHRARGAAGAGDRRGAVDALPRDLRSAADARARRAVPRRDRGSLRRRVRRRRWPTRDPAQTRADLVATAHRSAARRGAVELREPVDLVGRADSRQRRRSRHPRPPRPAIRRSGTRRR